MSTKLLTFIVSLFLAGCTTPQAALPKMEQYLSSACYQKMADPSILAYQYTVQSPFGMGVFAVAGEKSRQVCSFSSGRDGLANWGSLELLALARCEKLRSEASITSTCKVFARNFDIVWNYNKKHGLE